VAVAALYTAILFEPGSLIGWVGFGFAVWVSLCAFAALSFLASVAARSATVAIGLGLGALLILSFLVAIPNVGVLTPAGLLQSAAGLVVGAPGASSDVAGGLILGAATVALLLLIAIWAFRRQEL
jgi:hypothetical protein